MEKTSKESGQMPPQQTRTLHEKPKPSQKRMPCRPSPGLVSSPASSSTGPYSSSLPPPPPPPKTKKSWRRGKRGKRNLIRAVQHRLGMQNEEFWRIGDEPAPNAPKMKWLPSDMFLENCEDNLLARYANFLLQSLLILVRVFEIPSELKNRFGEGRQTVPRYALFLCRTERLRNPAAVTLLSLERHLYARMLKDTDGGRGRIDEIMKEEWKRDRVQGVKDRIDTWIKEHVVQGIAEGRYPKTNLQHNVEKQWENHWEDPNASSCSHLFTSRPLTMNKNDFKLSNHDQGKLRSPAHGQT